MAEKPIDICIVQTQRFDDTDYVDYRAFLEALSESNRLCKECRKCPFVSKCDNKRMEAMEYLEPKVAASASVDYAAPVLADILVKHDYRDIKVGENTTITIDVEELKRQIKKDFYKQLGIGFYPGAREHE